MRVKPVLTPASYSATLLLRGNATLLVEGRHDRDFALRLKTEIEKSKASPAGLVVDTAEMFAPIANVAGNRAVVEHVASSCSTAQRFRALVDREYRNFDIRLGTLADQLGNERFINPNVYWTRGHSLDNYFLTCDIVIDFLEEQWSSHLTFEQRQLVRSSYKFLIGNAAAFSLAMESHGYLSVCKGLVNVSMWQASRSRPGEIELDVAQVQAALARRVGRVSAPPGTPATAMIAYQGLVSSCTDCGHSVWLCHGHTGTDVLWSGIGRLVRDAGVAPSVADQIGSGQGEAKRTHGRGRLSAAAVSGANDALAALAEWIGSN